MRAQNKVKAGLQLLFLVLFTHTLYGQAKTDSTFVKGNVIDSANATILKQVAVTLSDAKTGQSLQTVFTDEAGRFALAAGPQVVFKLSFVVEGYKEKILSGASFPVTDHGMIFLKDVLLFNRSVSLKEVEIKSARRLIRQEVDRISYDVQADPASKVQNTLDMLRKVPFISIDASQNVQLKGSGNFKVLINGKPSSLTARNPTDVFRSMPASTILKIEVITVPPAKYDGEGLSGIINIITNKSVADGYNGSANASYNSIYGPGTGASFNFKKQKFGLSFLGGISRQPNRTTKAENERNTTVNNTTLLQQSANGINADYQYSGLDLSYELNKLSLLTGTLGYNRYKSVQIANQFNQFSDLSGLLQSYRLNTNINTLNTGTDIGINYQLGSKRDKNQLFTVSYKYTSSANEQNNTVIATERNDYTASDFLQQNNSGVKDHTAQVDYVRPMKKMNMEAGAKMILRNNYSEFQNSVFSPLSASFINDPLLTNQYTYHQDVYSLYNSWQLKLKNWGFKGGLRLENTVLNADFETGGQKLSDSYLNLIPSVSVMRSLGQSNSLTLGFTRRLQRPSIWQLNPFVNEIDPNFKVQGNPDLRPVLSNVLELSFSRFSTGYLIVSLNYSSANNTIQYVTTYNKADSTALNSYYNLGKNRNAGLNFTFNYPLTPKISFNTNDRVSYISINGYTGSTAYSNHGFQINTDVSFEYNFKEGWRFGLYSGYTGPGVNLQGKSSSYFYTSANIAREVFHKKGTLSAYVSNPFNRYFNARSYINSAEFNQVNRVDNIYRSFGCSFHYNFGRLKGNIKKNKRNINNDDVESGRKKIGN